MADISFRFAEKHRPDDYCTELTGGMQEPVPRDRIVSSKYVMEKWNPDEVVATLQLLDPRRAAIGLTCKEVPADVGGDFDLKEPIYGTEYKQTRLSDEFLKDVSGSSSCLPRSAHDVRPRPARRSRNSTSPRRTPSSRSASMWRSLTCKRRRSDRTCSRTRRSPDCGTSATTRGGSPRPTWTSS